MGSTRLTKATVSKLLQSGAASTTSTVHWDVDLGGFGLRHYSSGAASYIVDFRLKGSRVKRRVVLGSVHVLAPDAARERARLILADAREGIDRDIRERTVVATAEEVARQRAKRISVRESVRLYIDNFETTPSPRGGRQPAASSVRQASVWLARLVETLPEVALADITAKHVEAVLAASPMASRRNIYGAIKRLMTWARREGLIQAAVTEMVNPPARPAPRDRTPSPEEVSTLLCAADTLLESGRWQQVQRDAIWLAALTGQRRAEVAAMSWEDLDFEAGEWKQPGAKNKTSKAHTVPLGANALALLRSRWKADEEADQGLVLRGVRGHGRMDANLSDLQAVLRTVTGIAFRLHDFRRSMVSTMAERGVDFAVADALLNHVASESRGGMKAVYQRAELRQAKRRAMDIWENAIFPATAQVIRLGEQR